MTVAGVVVGVLIVAVVFITQFGSQVTGRLADPQLEYQAAWVDGDALGPADAPVTLEVWEDFQCPVCARHSLEVEPLIVSKYVPAGQLRIIHHDISFIGSFVGKEASDPTSESTIAARGAYCANEQGRYWQFAHWAYNNQAGENKGGFRRERVVDIATAAGLDPAAFGTCLDSQASLDHVVTSTGEAAAMSINSTPTLRINGGEPIRTLLSASDLGARIDAALEAASPSATTTP
jgi:protein-disulfide isomerase